MPIHQVNLLWLAIPQSPQRVGGVAREILDEHLVSLPAGGMDEFVNERFQPFFTMERCRTALLLTRSIRWIAVAAIRHVRTARGKSSQESAVAPSGRAGVFALQQFRQGWRVAIFGIAFTWRDEHNRQI